jgi:transposase
MHPARTLSVGMDVHHDASAVASVADDHPPDGVFLGVMGPRPGASDQRSRQLQSKRQPLVFGYAAGPCGDWRSRALRQNGHGGWGVAPSVMPQQAGDRGNTERRDAVPRARLMRSGDLTAGYGPQVEDEAIRDLSRAREEASQALKAATCRLNAVLLRHALRAPGRAPWGPAHRRWLSAGVCATPAPHIVCQESGRAGHEPTARLPRLAHARHEPVHTWRLQPVLEALHAWRGVPGTGAGTIVAALGELPRVAPPDRAGVTWACPPQPTPGVRGVGGARAPRRAPPRPAGR